MYKTIKHFEGVQTNNRPAGPMARRLTTNQEIAGSTPASVIFSLSLTKRVFYKSYLLAYGDFFFFLFFSFILSVLIASIV